MTLLERKRVRLRNRRGSDPFPHETDIATFEDVPMPRGTKYIRLSPMSDTDAVSINFPLQGPSLQTLAVKRPIFVTPDLDDGRQVMRVTNAYRYHLENLLATDSVNTRPEDTTPFDAVIEFYNDVRPVPERGIWRACSDLIPPPYEAGTTYYTPWHPAFGLVAVHFQGKNLMTDGTAVTFGIEQGHWRRDGTFDVIHVSIFDIPVSPSPSPASNYSIIHWGPAPVYRGRCTIGPLGINVPSTGAGFIWHFVGHGFRE